MEFFARLHRFYEAVKALNQESAQWRVINSSQIDEVARIIDARLKRVDAELRPEADDIEEDLRGIEAHFFQLEAERIKEKFRVLVSLLEKARQLMVERQIFLAMLQDFRKLIENCVELSENARALPPTADDTPDKLKRISNDLKDLQDKARADGDRIATQQRRACMTVTDFENSIQRLNEAVGAPTTALIGSESDAQVSERIAKLERELLPLLAGKITAFVPNTNNEEQPQYRQRALTSDVTDYILANMDQSAKEKAIIDDIARCLDRLPTTSSTPADHERLQEQRRQHDERNRARREHINNAVADCVLALREEVQRMDALIQDAIVNRDADTVQALDGEWKLCKQTLIDLERALDPPALASLRENWMTAFRDLERHSLDVDNKIKRYTKHHEREQKLLKNLAAFAQWLDLVETDVNNTKTRPDLEPSERSAQLQQLKDNLESYLRLANKLEAYRFSSEPQAVFAREQTAKYRRLLDQLNRMNLPPPPAKNVPIHVITDLPSTSAMEQLSVASTSSFASEVDRRLADDDDDVQSQLDLVQSDFVRQASVRVAREIPLKPSQKGADLLRSLAENPDASLPIDDIRQAVADFTDKLRGIREFYDMIPLKSLERAQQDLPQLKDLLASATLAEQHLAKIIDSARQKPSEHTLLQSIGDDLQAELVAGNSLADALDREIVDEQELSKVYKDIMQTLATIEDEVRQAAAQERKPKAKESLRQVALEMDILRQLCKKPRRYIATSIDGSPLSTPTRRRKLVLRITNSVMTIIKVVEDQMKQQPSLETASTSKAADLSPALQQIYDNLHMIKAAFDEEVTPPISAQPSFDVSADVADIDQLIQQAEEIRSNLELLGETESVLQEPQQYDLLIRASREGRSGLEQILEKIDEVSDTPDNVKEYRNRVVDLIQSLLDLEDKLTVKQKESQDILDKYQNELQRIHDATDQAESTLKLETPSAVEIQQVSEAVNAALESSAPLAEPSGASVAQHLADDLVHGRDVLGLISQKLNEKSDSNVQLQDLLNEAYGIIHSLKALVQNVDANAPYDLAAGYEIADKFTGIQPQLQRLNDLSHLIREVSPNEPVIDDIIKASDTVAAVQNAVQNEVADEETQRKKHASLRATFDLIPVNDNETPVLTTMKSAIDAELATKPQRTYIKHDNDPLIDLLNQIDDKTRKIEDKKAYELQTKISDLQQAVEAISEAPTDNLLEQLQAATSALPEDDPAVADLHNK
uniref:Microtubule associated protein n=1 Tax=Panagrellus redivivus TaxID=6233 RepID=A0A7E4W4D8_PANRE